VDTIPGRGGFMTAPDRLAIRIESEISYDSLQNQLMNQD
jgi:hypothetical protein